MSLTTSEMSCADIAAVMGANRNDNGFGDMGSGWWIILLFLCLFGNGGWGGNYGGGNNGGAGGLYPWMNQADITNSGFRDQMINDNITSIRDGIYGLSNQLCSCCGDMRDTVNSGFYNAEIAAANRQMANMNTAFGMQNAMTQGFNGVQSSLAQCCCDNRLGIADLKYTVATENCADRNALAEATRDIIASQVAGFQSIKDMMCADKIDAKNDEISQLRQELLYARGQASQDVQTAAIRTGQATTANQLVQELRSCPIPAMPVYGQTPIFTCNGNGGCGCGCGVA